MSSQVNAGLSTSASSSPLELLQVALYLHDISVKSNKLTNPEKVFPQFNSEKSLFAYACQVLFQGKTGLDANELQQAREFVRPLQAGFRALFGYLLQSDVYLKAKVDSQAFNSDLFFERTNTEITSQDGVKYAIAVKRMMATNAKKGIKELITSLVFIPVIDKPIVANLGTPQATAPAPQSFINAQTPAQAIAQGNVPPVTNGVHAPASM